jgi:uncharacterized membrane protein YuzA (DUF378 family)
VNNLNPITWLAVILLAVGGVNWGLVGLFEFDLVASLFGEEFGTTNTVTRVVYTLVGVSAIVTLAGLAVAQMRSPRIQVGGQQRSSLQG